MLSEMMILRLTQYVGTNLTVMRIFEIRFARLQCVFS